MFHVNNVMYVCMYINFFFFLPILNTDFPK